MSRTVPPWWAYRLVTKVSDFVDRLSAAVSPSIKTNMMHVAGHFSTQVVYTAIELGVIDALLEGDKDLEQLAQATECDREALLRLMRVICRFRIVEKSAGRYRLTKKGKGLGDRALQDHIRLCATLWIEMFSGLPQSIKTGRKNLPQRFNNDFFTYLSQDRSVGAKFDTGMVALSELSIPAIIAEYDFTPYQHIVDVGGGFGQMIFAVMEQNSHCRGTLFDLQSTLAEVKNRFPDRCQLKQGSFFESVPTGGDLYMLKTILHDWDDNSAKKILSCCRSAMAPGSRLLLMEILMNQDEENYLKLYIDLLMLQILDGKERSLEELDQLLAETGFRRTAVFETRSFTHIIEAECV